MGIGGVVLDSSAESSIFKPETTLKTPDSDTYVELHIAVVELNR